MQADFEIIANNNNITEQIRDRLLELKIVDKQGLDSDELEIQLDDRDGKVEFPPKGATLRVSLGWMGSGLHYMGTYRVDEIELSGPPTTLSIKAKPADMRQDARSQRSLSYEDTTLAGIVTTIAGRNGWAPVCEVTASVPRSDQIGESDLHFVTRLARQYGATATVKDGKLLVLPRDGGKSASGKSLPVIVLRPSDLDNYRLTFPDRGSFGKVKASAHDNKTGKQINLEIPNPSDTSAKTGGEHVDRHVYPNSAAAKAAAQSRQESLNRSTARGSLTLMGRADVAAEITIGLMGFKAGADGNYLIESVAHSYAGKSWVTTIEVNAGNGGKAKVGHKGSKGASTNLAIPAPP